MDQEIEFIKRNNTWKFVELSKGNETIGVKYVYKTILNVRGEVERCKTHLLAKGYKQKEGINYHEVFALVAPLDTISYGCGSCSPKSMEILP